MRSFFVLKKQFFKRILIQLQRILKLSKLIQILKLNLV